MSNGIKVASGGPGASRNQTREILGPMYKPLQDPKISVSGPKRIREIPKLPLDYRWSDQNVWRERKKGRESLFPNGYLQRSETFKKKHKLLSSKLTPKIAIASGSLLLPNPSSLSSFSLYNGGTPIAGSIGRRILREDRGPQVRGLHKARSTPPRRPLLVLLARRSVFPSPFFGFASFLFDSGCDVMFAFLGWLLIFVQNLVLWYCV